MDAVDLPDVIDAADVRMLNPGRDAGLAVEALDDVAVFVGAEVRHLEGDAAAELAVLGEIDGAHAALAQLADDAVTAKLGGQLSMRCHDDSDSNEKGSRSLTKTLGLRSTDFSYSRQGNL